MEYTCHPMVAIKLIEREVCHLKKHIDKYSGRKIAIFAAGNYGERFYHILKTDFGIDAEFFIDNNPKFTNGGKVCGKSVMFEPWKTDPDFTHKYFILIATKATWVEEISAQLDKVGVPCISSDAYTVTLLWERVKNIVRLLDDDNSKTAYLGLMWYWLTHDISLCQSSGELYFNIKFFSSAFHEIIADVGAYVGDTLEEYVRRSLGNCKIYAFEPDDANRAALELRLKRLKSEWRMNHDDLIVIPAAVGAQTGNVCFKEISMASYISDTGEKNIEIYTLDDFFKDKLSPSLIKADIEGEEQNMISGAAKLIKNHKPKMAISIYHDPTDFVKLPEMIKELNVSYNFAVRTHSSCYEDTVLYCYV